MRNIDPYLLEKIEQQQQTIHNKTNPKMSIEVARAKTTVMDSTYWTVETIRTKEGLGDLSIAARRQRPYGSPDRLYSIYIDNGIVKTAIREYPDYQENKWQNQFDIGAGKSVAIAFDGIWERYRKGWQLVTEENPYLFWVDNSNKLWVQAWDDENTQRELATNVNKVKAIRGWKNINFIEKDHGLIAAYIKTDGRVYYRGFCTQEDGSVVWEPEREVEEFTGTAVNINLFVTNDYRTGFVIEDSQSNIHMLITERNWAGMAIPPERVVVAPTNIEINFISLQYHNRFAPSETIVATPAKVETELGYALTDNKFLNIYNEPLTLLDENNEEYEDWGKILIFETKHRLYNTNVGDFEVVGTRGSYFADIIEEVGHGVYKLIFEGFNNFNNAGNNPTLKFNGVYTTNYTGDLYDVFESSFEALNLVPEFIPLPEVEAIWNE